MRAVGINSYGGPEALEVVELPDPHAGPGEVRIRVHAATVNPTDTYIGTGARAAMQQSTPKPYVPGMDAAGVLDEIGPGVETPLRVGDRLMAIVLPSGNHGAYSELIVVPVESVALAPRGVDHVAASTLPMNGLTARLSLDQLALTPGQTLLVTGAAGCYGGYVVQLAKADGLRVIGDASDADRDLVASLGADIVLARGPDLAARVLALQPGGVDAIADGAVMNEQILPAVRDGGGFATVRGWAGPAERDVVIHHTWVRDYLRASDRLNRLGRQVEEGAITLRVAQTFSAEQAGDAHRTLQAGGIRGRLVITF